MSFVEKNKVWLLPLLAAGVLAVGWFNYQSFKPGGATPPPPAPADPTAMVAPNPAPSAPVAPEPAVQASGVGDATSGLWDDLKPLATVPPGLTDLGPLESLARGVLSDSVLKETAGDPTRLRAPRLWQPEAPPRAGRGEGGEGEPAPAPDIVVHLPEGGRAWFDGSGYREQEDLRGSRWRVRRILPRAVELQGPGGVTLKPVHPTKTSDAAEENP
jgi:hypothetical protein